MECTAVLASFASVTPWPGQHNNTTINLCLDRPSSLQLLVFTQSPALLPRFIPTLTTSLLYLNSTSCAAALHAFRVARDRSPSDLSFFSSRPKHPKSTWCLILINCCSQFCSVNNHPSPSLLLSYLLLFRSLICRAQARSSTIPLVVLGSHVEAPQGNPTAYSFRDRVGEQSSLLFLLPFQPHVFQLCLFTSCLETQHTQHFLHLSSIVPSTYTTQYTQPRSSPSRFMLNQSAFYGQWPAGNNCKGPPLHDFLSLT